MTTPLQQLGEHGQSVWLDFISRELVTTGQLQHRVAEENVTGMTSNPTIFQKAIAEGTLYDDQIRELIDVRGRRSPSTCSPSWRSPTSSTPRTSSGPCTSARPAPTAT